MKWKRTVSRNYNIYYNKSCIKGTNYIEIGPGRYSGKHWNEGYIFIDEDSFIVVEGIIKKHYNKYDHYQMNNISRTKGYKIISNLRAASEHVAACTGKEILEAIEYRHNLQPSIINQFIRQKSEISKLLDELANFIENAYKENNWICVLGV